MHFGIPLFLETPILELPTPWYFQVFSLSKRLRFSRRFYSFPSDLLPQHIHMKSSQQLTLITWWLKKTSSVAGCRHELTENISKHWACFFLAWLVHLWNSKKRLFWICGFLTLFAGVLRFFAGFLRVILVIFFSFLQPKLISEMCVQIISRPLISGHKPWDLSGIYHTCSS